LPMRLRRHPAGEFPTNSIMPAPSPEPDVYLHLHNQPQIVLLPVVSIHLSGSHFPLEPVKRPLALARQSMLYAHSVGKRASPPPHFVDDGEAEYHSISQCRQTAVPSLFNNSIAGDSCSRINPNNRHAITESLFGF